MKLKLETQNNVTVLVVSETIEASHLPVLKAGLTKLFQSGKKTILLDFSSIAETDFKDPSLLQQIADLRTWAPQFSAQVVNVSPIQKLGHAATREEGIKLLSSPLGQLQALEASLKAHQKQLEQKKAVLTQKLSQSGGNDLKKIQRENSSLKKSLAEAEKTAKRFVKQRTRDPSKIPEVELTQQNLAQLLDGFLKTEGVLK